MKVLSDFLPIILFFIAYKFYGIYTATAVAIAAALIQSALFWAKHRRLEKMHIISSSLLVFFGGLTLLLQDETFIKWKPTVVNWLFAVAFLGSQFIGQKNFIERLMGANISLPSNIWALLNYSWVSFFIVLGASNLYVAFNYDTDIWVDFKLFGMMGITFAFIIIQGIFLSRYMNAVQQAETKE